MADVAQDKLQLARAKFLDQITSKEAEIRVLRDKLALIDEVEGLFKDTDNISVSPQKYSGMKLTKAIFDAVESIGTNGGVAATDVRMYVAANGYKHPNPANFPVATVIALTRLADQGRIISSKDGGKRLYRAKR